MPLSRTKKLTRKQKQRRLQRWQRRLAANDPLYDRSGQIKMSEVLLDFIEPYREDAASEMQLRDLIATGVLAWNAAILRHKSREEIVERAIHDVIPSGAEEFRELLSEMIERKQRYFARFTRFILNHELTMTPDGSHLTVLSTLF